MFEYMKNHNLLSLPVTTMCNESILCTPFWITRSQVVIMFDTVNTAGLVQDFHHMNRLLPSGIFCNRVSFPRPTISCRPRPSNFFLSTNQFLPRPLRIGLKHEISNFFLSTNQFLPRPLRVGLKFRIRSMMMSLMLLFKMRLGVSELC